MTAIRALKLKDAGPLHDKLLAACPPAPDGTVSVSILAARLGVSTAAIYKWIHEDRVPPARVPELVRLQRDAYGEVRVAAEDLNPIFR